LPSPSDDASAIVASDFKLDDESPAEPDVSPPAATISVKNVDKSV
jgi:hypothetical protein